MKIEEMLAREGIRRTMAHYNNTGDRGAIEELLTLFTPEGVLQTQTSDPDHNKTLNGREAIREYFQSLQTSGHLVGTNPRPTRHHLTTSRIELTSDTTAQSWTYFLLVRDGVILQNGTYIDQFIREGDNWLFEYRRVKVEHTSI